MKKGFLVPAKQTSAEAGGRNHRSSNITAKASVEASAPSLAQLATLISRLGQTCPWTRAQGPQDMLFWTRKECLEVEEVIRKPAPIDTKALTKELGDVLFDVLMMIEVTGREHDVTLESCCASACEKLRQRSPYLFSGASPKSIEEAEAMWQAGKRQEAADSKGKDPAPPPKPLPAPVSSPPTVLSQSKPVLPPEQPPASADPAPLPAPLPVSSPPAASPQHKSQLQPEQPIAAASSILPVAAASRGAVDSEGEDPDEDGLAEWEADFRRDAGPTSDDAMGSEDDDEPLSDDLLEELRHEVRATSSRTSSRQANSNASGD